MAQPVSWFEIHGKDGRKSRAFYTELFGWEIDASNPMNYGMVNGAEGGIGGGIAESPVAPMVTIYIAVPNVDEALKKAVSLGAKAVMGPDDVPGGPRIAQFSDPDGNVIGIMTMPTG
ncbi:MAG: VOC family protein [Chloroflexi bacterium]|nr:VOC family protein [Chloroflexota bacterium]